MMPVSAHSLRPAYAAVERLIHNTTQYVRQHPGDAQAYYLLGRLHSYVFAEVGQAPVRPGRHENELIDLEDGSNTGPARESRASMPAGQRYHFFASVECYRRAIQLDPTVALYHFTLAWMEQQGAEFSEELGRPSERFVDDALKDYREAYQLADDTLAGRPEASGRPIAAEAGERIVGILEERYPASDRSTAALLARAEILSIADDLKGNHRRARPDNAVISSR